MPITLRDKRKELTRDNIVLAAVRLVRQGGEEAVTMRAVAAAVGITERTVFRHFNTRDDLLSTFGLSYRRSPPVRRRLLAG